MLKGVEVIRITRKQKCLLKSLRISKYQHYHEVLENILGDYRKFKEMESSK
jgi:hypothetical protein